MKNNCAPFLIPLLLASALPSSALALDVIDANLVTKEKDGKPFDKEALLKEMKDAGVVGGVAYLSQEGKGYADLRESKVIHCGTVTGAPDLPELEAGLKSGKYGCLKIYLGFVHKFASDKMYAPIYKLAKKHDVAVAFHTGDTSSAKSKLKYADPLTVDEVATDHPDVRFVLNHCGNPWTQTAAEVAYKNPNVYLECSAMLVGNLDEMPKEKVDEYLVKPISWIFGYVEDPSKILFGSHWPASPIASYLKAYQRAIPKEHWQAVFHDNAAKVFKLKK
jgi:hypothetical protein